MEPRQKKIEGLLENVVYLIMSSNGATSLPEECRKPKCKFLQQPIRKKEELTALVEVLKNEDEIVKNQLVLN